eukprot:5092413-Prymnesium_polylepis.1
MPVARVTRWTCGVIFVLPSSSPSAWMHSVLWSDAALEVVYGRRSHVGADIGHVLRSLSGHGYLIS